MTNNQKDNDILKKYYSEKGCLKYKVFKNMPDDDKQYIENRFNDYIESLKEGLFRIRYNIEIRPICPICGCNVKYYGKPNRPYSDCCSMECANICAQQQIRKTSLEKYGVEHPAKSKESIEKHKQYYKEHNIKEKLKNATKLKYGVDNVFQLNSVKEKIKSTCIKKYGVDNAAKSEEIKSKTKETCFKKYGTDAYLKSNEFKEKSKKTCLEKYGVDNGAKSEEIKKKIKKTCLEKYGVDAFAKSKLFWDKYDKVNAKKKEIETKRKNGTFNTSIPEQKSYELLKEKFPDTKYQYRSDQYPFACDFYIPSLDLYIECNYHWTHGKKPFEDNENDNMIVEKWKEKGTKYYMNAINTWTKLDVKKRTIAKENKLNYLEFWDIKELKEWLNNASQ